MEIIDCKHPEWEEMLYNSVVQYKTTIHHFEREGSIVKPVLWCEVPFTPRRDERQIDG